MKKKRLLALFLACTMSIPTLGVSAAENEPTPPSEEISVEEPAADDPIGEEIIIEGPAEEENLIDEPVIDEPFIEEPVIEQPIIEEPIIDEPIIDEPDIDEPIIEEPIIEESIIKEAPLNSLMLMTNEGNSLVPMATIASGSCGSNLKWTLDSNGTLTINGTGTMTDFPTYKDPPWYSRRASIKTISIQSGVTSIGDLAFCWCENLTSVTIPTSVTSIGDSAFLECTNLTSIKIPNKVSSIGIRAFYNCTNLASVTIPYGVDTISEEAFMYCKSLNSVTLPNSVTIIDEYAFAGCNGLTSIIIPDSVRSIYKDAFNGCRNLRSITFGKNLSSISYCAFYYAYLNTIIFKGNAPTIKGDSFLNVTATAYYPANNDTWTAENKLNYGGKLTWKTWTCEMLNQEHSIVTQNEVPPTCTETGLSEGEYCSVCGKITLSQTIVPANGHTEVTIPGKPATSTETGLTDGIVCGVCGKVLKEQEIIEISLPGGECGTELTWEFNPETGTLTISGTGAMENYSSRTAPWYEYADQITNLVVEENVLSIGKYALDGCSNLKTVSIPSTLTLIDQYAFSSASQMTDVYYNGTKSEWENISKKFGNTTLNGKIIHPIMAEGIGGNTDTDVEANASISYFGNFTGTFSPDSITAMKGTDAPRLVFAVDSYDNNDAADGSMFEFTVKLDNAKFIKDEKNPITVDDAISMFFITTSETNTTLASATNEFVPVGYDGWKPMTGGSNDLDSHDLLLNVEISEDHTQITYTIFAGKDAPIGNGSKFGVTLQSMLTETTPGTEASVTVIGDVCDGDELVYCQVLPDTYEIESLNIKENAESSDYLDAIPATSFTAEIDVKTGTTSNTLILAGYDADNRMVFMKYQTVSSDNKTYLIDVENTDSSIKKLTVFFVSQEESKEPLTKNISIPA